MHALSRFATGRICSMYSGAFALYFRPHRRAFDSLCPSPREFAIHKKKEANSGGSAPGGGAGRSWNC